MDKQLVQQLIASGSTALTSFAHVAKTTAEHLYGVLVRQAMVEGIATIVLLFLWTLLGYLGWLQVYKQYKEAVKRNPYSRGDDEFFAFLKTLGLFLVLVIGGLFLKEAIQQILNPEFYAIQYIFDTVNNK